MTKEKKKAKSGVKAKKAGATKTAKPAKASKTLKAMAANPVVQEVVAAALVATAAALKDTKKARAMAVSAGDQLEALAEEGAEKGRALWALALDVAKRAGEIIQEKPKKTKKSK